MITRVYGSDGLFTIWQEEDYELKLWNRGDCLRYEFCFEDRLMFSGSEFLPNLGYATSSDFNVGSLLGYLSLQPEDISLEFTECYTDTQRTFCTEHGEKLLQYGGSLQSQEARVA